MSTNTITVELSAADRDRIDSLGQKIDSLIQVLKSPPAVAGAQPSATVAPASTAEAPTANKSANKPAATSSAKSAPAASTPKASSTPPAAADTSPSAAPSSSTPSDAGDPLAVIGINDIIAAGTRLAKLPATDANDPKSSGKEKLRAIFAKHGAANVQQIKAADYPQVLASINALAPAAA